MHMNFSASTRFDIINETLKSDNNLLNISELCKIAGVSRTGYYYWLNSQKIKLSKEEQDQLDFDLILTAFKHKGYDKGVRSIHMQLLHNSPSIIMNIKKIRRLMHKFNLKCPIRKANPYRKMAKAVQSNRCAPNILNRAFKAYGARKVLLTDITYIPRSSHHKDGSLRYTYVSVIMDAYTKQILACVCSTSFEVDFVLDTIKQLMTNYGSELRTDALIHSDQGCHYTSHKFTEIVKDYSLRQSMSRRGNCWDNAPQESLFGHMKSELKLLPSDAHYQIEQKVLDWIDYYNNDRYQWSLAKLSPNEYYTYTLTGEYPLDTTNNICNNITRGSAPNPEV
ncbi:MAG: IS3 family transposase [Candidatus Cloacimonetes bacterium]|nr:IS3 family transposase [Candidatus Cloacimonadota bacterium]